MITVEQSYRYCLKVARTRAKNFYYSFVLLSRQQRKAMCAIYAFMRYCDDLSDEPGASRAAVDKWRAELEEALEGRCIETFDDLYQYCYRVASVVGLTIIHIFGFDTRSALPLAEKCGVAFQLTNILRDIREDAERGRVYIPAEDLRRFGVSEDDLRAGRRDEPFLRLMRFEAARARAYYDESAPLLDLIHPRSRSSLQALIAIYSRLLDRIEGTNYDVFTRRVRLSLFEKSWIVVRAMVG
jgi:15-cis-phytoene synthase